MAAPSHVSTIARVARLLGEDEVQAGVALEDAAEDQVVHGDAGRLADEVEVADDPAAR